MNRLKAALIAVEDRRFYRHWGIDLIAIFRAFLVNLREKRRAQGGSTVTQQLARILYLNNRKTYSRKILEILIAFYLELRYGKEKILNRYVEKVYMGHTWNGNPVTGFYEASIYYFGSQVEGLSIAEIAALVAMVKGPNFYKLDSNAGIARRIFVLGKMLENGIITQDEFFNASKINFGRSNEKV